MINNFFNECGPNTHSVFHFLERKVDPSILRFTQGQFWCKKNKKSLHDTNDMAIFNKPCKRQWNITANFKKYITSIRNKQALEA